MNSDYIAALNGTLKSTKNGINLAKIDLRNFCGIPIRLVWVNELGDHVDYGVIQPGQASTILATTTNYKYIIQSALSGGFMFVYTPTVEDAHQPNNLNPSALTDPNDIGPFPKRTSTILIPQDSPLVMVACAPAYNGNYITREQYWKRQPDSFSLASGEKRVVSVTTTHGMQKTSSSSETIAAAVGSSVNGGWGPVSASISASLNVSASFFQQVTVNEETSVYESKELHYDAKDDQPKSVTYFVWQLMDIITVYDKRNSQPIASVSSGEAPSIVDGPYPGSQVQTLKADEPVEPLKPSTLTIQPMPSRGNVAAQTKSKKK